MRDKWRCLLLAFLFVPALLLGGCKVEVDGDNGLEVEVKED
jgi:hypothetical protein